MAKRTPCPKTIVFAESQEIWREVTDGWNFEPHHLRILQCACEQWDVKLHAIETLKKAGRYTDDGRRHAAVKDQLDATAMVIRAMRELGLDLDAASSTLNRPPAIRARLRA